MKAKYFSIRNLKEILRDPVSIILGVFLPFFLVFLFTRISINARIDAFRPINVVPGVSIFGFTFTSLFVGLLMARDKSALLLMRLFVSPMRSKDFIMGYFFPMLPISFIIGVCCLSAGLFVGIPLSINVLITLASFIPFVLFSISFGIFLGAICNETQIMAFGNIYIIASALFSGAWMDISLLGGDFAKAAQLLPITHAVKVSRMALSGNIDSIWKHGAIVSAYAVVFFLLAVLFFNREMNSDKK